VALMKRIILIRHAQAAMAGKFCGHSDPDLNAAGQMQMAQIVDQVLRHQIDRIVSSDLSRDFRTAEAIGQKIGIEPKLRPRLREIHFGLWEGLSWNEITDQYPNEARSWIGEFPTRSAPDGELYTDFCERIEAEFKLLIGHNSDRATAVVTHRGPMRYALTRFFGWSKQKAFEQTADYGAVLVVPDVATGQEALP